MRFAYIDSNGNEVPIPSVDALALRIELGAITSDTELYDAQADQWGPAHTHEIFHTLSRSAEDDGFVAPPPPMAAPAASPESTAEEPEAPAEEASAVEEPVEEEVTLADAGAGDAGLTLADSADGSSGAEDGGLTLADGPDEPAPDFSGIDLAPETEGGMMAAEEPAAADEAPMSFDAPAEAGGDDAAMDFGAAPTLADEDQADDEPEEEGPSFDFGDMGGGLELEEEFEAPDDAGEPAMDFSSGATVGEGDGGLGIADAGGDFGGGLEQAMDFSSAGAGTGGGGLDLEQPMSEFTPEAPPAWMEGEGGDAGGDQVMDFSSMSSEGEAEAPGTTTRTRTPKDKPSKPKFKKERNYWPIVGGVLIVALGLGGYTAWPIIQGMITDESAEGPVVVMPAIDQALIPEMRAVSDAAYSAWFGEQRAGVGTVIGAPSDDWLAGVYLANASQYDAVATFWEDVGRVLDAVEEIDLAAYHGAFETALGSSGVDAANHAIVAERADSGFVAAGPSRAATFGLLEDLVAAATDLHDFLVANEANIEHAPATIVTTDPVLEARTTPEIREAMVTRIDAVTHAQGALDFLQFPTSDELWAMMLAQIQESGIQ